MHIAALVTAAIRDAASQVHLYRQGRDWIVSVWDALAGAWRADQPRTFWAARSRARRLKIQLALEQLGLADDEAEDLACSREGPIQDVVRRVMRDRGRT